MRARILLIVTVLAVAGCTHHSGAPTPAAQPVSGGSSPAPKSFDPPTKFRQDKGVPVAGTADLPAPVLLHQTTLFVAATDHLDVVDALTGTVRGTVRPQAEPATGAGRPAPPVLAQVDGRTLAIAALPVRVAGHRAVELLAVDVATGQPAWRLPVEAAGDPAVPVGVHGHTIVLAAGGNTAAIDVVARKLLWTKPFAADLLAGDVVLAGGAHGAVAVSVTDGTPRWTSRPGQQVYVRSGGPNLIVTTGGTGGAYFFDLLDPATGTPRYSSGGGGSSALQCRYDEQSVTVCWQDVQGSRWVGGFDAVTGQSLWHLPGDADGRDAPTVTAVWHGAVYGTAASGPVVLDAHTGADRNAAPGAAPVLVDQYVGVASSAGHLAAYPAAG